MNLVKTLTSSLLAAGLLSVAIPAQATMLKLTDEAFNGMPGTERSFRELVTRDEFYARFIRDIIPNATATVTAGTFRKNLRVQLAEFVTKGSTIAWQRSDLVDFTKNLVGKKCTAVVSCQIAFDLTVAGVDPFLKEIGEAGVKAINPKIALMQEKLDAVAKEIVALPEGTPARLAKQEELVKMIDEIAPLEQTREAATKLAETSSPLDLIKGACPKP